MNASYEFKPSQRAGLTFHMGAIAVLGIITGIGLWQAGLADISLVFVLYLLPALVGVVAMPFLAYRLMALRRAFYRLERDGITLRWGLRSEDIPIDSVQWVRPMAELGGTLPLPWLRWPGAVVGSRRLPGGGSVEFMADDSQRLVLIGTQRGIFAISPEDPATFLSTYNRLTELGSLSPLPARSVYPTFLLARVWRRRSVRAMFLIGLALNLLLLTWVILVAPTRGQIVLGFQRGAEPLPAVQLLLLPVLSSFFFLVDFFAGLFFYRRSVLLLATPAGARATRAPNMILAYLLWIFGVLTPLLFFVAVSFILLS